jgi:hypothetical protein
VESMSFIHSYESNSEFVEKINKEEAKKEKKLYDAVTKQLQRNNLDLFLTKDMDIYRI